MSRLSSPRGFSMLELIVAMAIVLIVTSAVFAMLDPASGAFQAQPEAADVLQRLRAGSEALRRDVMLAGNPPSVAGQATPNGQAAVFPMRIGRRTPDPAGSFDDTRMSFWSVSPAAPHAVLASPLPSVSGVATVVPGSGCADGSPACGFAIGSMVAVFGQSGIWDLFSVTSVQGNDLSLRHNLRDSMYVHPAGTSTIAEVTARTYFFSDDPAAGFARLLRYDDGGGGDVPVVDHVASLRFEYLGEADPPAIVPTPPGDPSRSTYGPLPPPVATSVTNYPPGENCAFARAPDGAVVPRLVSLGPSPSLVRLPRATLVDGPWCPDAGDANRYDADLLRIRQIVVSLRIESAVVSLRGPAGPLFTRGGTARGNRFVPDRAERLVIAPRALNAAR